MSDNGDSPPRNRKRAGSGEGDRQGGERVRKRHYSDGGPRVEVRLLIPSRDAGTIIGKGGLNIKRLRQDFKAGVSVSDSDNRGPERVLIICGELDSLGDIVADVYKTLEEKYKGDRDRRDQDSGEMRMLIHQSQAGCVIGKGGGKLKEFRNDFGVDVKVFSQCCPLSTERIVKVIGSPRSASKCLVSIIDMLRTWPPKGYSNPYDPSNSDDLCARDYGGYVDERGGRSSGGGREFGGGRGFGGGRDDFGGRDRDRMGSRRSPDRGFGGGGMGAGLGFLDSMRGSIMTPRTTQQVSIPADLAGVIIGRQGSRIKQIREESHADVELSDPKGGSSDRIITITGTPDEIQNAQYMLQMSVKQHLDRERENRDGGRDNRR